MVFMYEKYEQMNTKPNMYCQNIIFLLIDLIFQKVRVKGHKGDWEGLLCSVSG